MNETIRAKLRHVSTATLATALFKRGLRQQMIQGVHPLHAPMKSMVGPAYTLRTIPAREDLNGIEVLRDHANPQRAAVEQCPAGAVLVIDSRKSALAASAGGILATRLMVRGVAGIVTDGGLRDSAEIASLTLPAYHQRPSAPTSLVLNQAVGINEPIGCGDAPVWPGDIIVGDADGVIVIPANIVEAIAEEAVEMTVFEDFVTERVRGGQSILGLYPPTDAANLVAFKAWREKAGR